MAAAVCCLWAGGCVSGSLHSDPPAAHSSSYVVQPGDTLYGIAWRHDLDYRDLARWNHIGSDFALVVGQVLELHAPQGPAGEPDAAQPAVAVPRKPAPPKPAVPSPFAPNPASQIPATRDPVARKPAPEPTTAPAETGTRWVWPTDKSGTPRSVPGGGVLLFGRLGQDVRAAASGRVVYTGSGLRSYGNLIIIKHGESLLSSYAHNRELLVHEGQEVSAGQVIAHMGAGPHRVAALYFEIRINGKPRDPLKYLSVR